MSFTLQAADDNVTAMLHGGSLNKVRNKYVAYERAANVMLQKLKTLESIRIAALAQAVHDDIYNYSLPSDFLSLIDLYPLSEYDSHSKGQRRLARDFNLRKAITDQTISIEGQEGTKNIRINWRRRTPKTMHTMNSLTDNGTWAVVATASGLVLDEFYFISGNGAIRFDAAASGDGISNTGMTALDLTDEDEIADFFVWVYFPSVSALTSVSARWGNDISANYWASTAQTTQADGTAFRAGWNLLRFPWSTATETGTVAPATVDSFRLTVAVTSALADIRVDNIMVSIGRNFDIKYYGKYLFKNSSGTYIAQPTSQSDSVILDSDAFNIFLFESLIAMAHQLEGTDSAFDISFASRALYGDPSAPDPAGRSGLYAMYRGEHPDQSVKAIGRYGATPRYGDRW